MTPALERVRPARTLTERQARIVALVSDGLSYWAVGQLMGCSDQAVKACVEKVAGRIPGNLPPRAKVIVWWRGATLTVLMGVPASAPLEGSPD